MYKTILAISMCLTVFIFTIIGCSNNNTIQELEKSNKATVKMIHAELVKGNVDIFDKVLSPDYVRHCQAMPPELQEMHGSKQLKLFIEDFIGSVTNYTDSVGPIIADSNIVAYVSTMRATNSGSMGGLPPSGKDFEVVNLVMHRFENGKIAETWVTWDNVAVLSQLGFFPPPQPKKE